LAYASGFAECWTSWAARVTLIVIQPGRRSRRS
jgi:hypothetical protein